MPVFGITAQGLRDTGNYVTLSHMQHSLSLCVPFCALQPQIFSTLGLTQSGALLGTLTVSAVNIAATIIAILAVDRCA